MFMAVSIIVASSNKFLLTVFILTGVKDCDTLRWLTSLEMKRLAGGAWQLWQTLRLFPLVISSHILDPNDEVFMLLFKLKDIVEMIVAPEFHYSFLNCSASSMNI